MFRVGDLIMYGGTGVCRVKELMTTGSDETGEDRYYILEPVYQNGIIYAPIGSEKVFMRPLISAAEALDIIDTMPGISPDVFVGTSTQQLARHYQEIISSHDTTRLIMMAKAIHLKNRNAMKQNRRLGQIDKKYMKLAEDFLFGEFACSLNISRDKVEDFIRERLGTDPMESE